MLLPYKTKRNKLHNEFFRCAHLITPFPQDLVALAETLMHANRHGWKYERVPSLSEEHAPFETLKRETLRLTELALIAGNFAWQKVIVDRKNKRFPQTNTSCTTRFYSLYWAIRAGEKRNIVSYVNTYGGANGLRTSVTLAILAQEGRIEYSPSSLYEDENLESARSSLNEILS